MQSRAIVNFTKKKAKVTAMKTFFSVYEKIDKRPRLHIHMHGGACIQCAQ